MHLIRDLRLALADGDAKGAEHQLSRLRLDGRLSSQNLDFLQIEFLGRLGDGVNCGGFRGSTRP